MRNSVPTEHGANVVFDLQLETVVLGRVLVPTAYQRGDIELNPAAKVSGDSSDVDEPPFRCKVRRHERSRCSRDSPRRLGSSGLRNLYKLTVKPEPEAWR